MTKSCLLSVNCGSILEKNIQANYSCAQQTDVLFRLHHAKVWSIIWGIHTVEKNSTAVLANCPSTQHRSLMNIDHKSRRKPVECRGCKKTYIGKFEAERHYEKSCFFNPDRNVKCNICKNSNGPTSELLGHLKKEHDSKAKFLCTRCLKEISSQKKLDEHLKTCKM